MASLEEIKNTKLFKLEILKKAGINPYPIDCKIDFSITEVIENFIKISQKGKEITVGGRVMSLRPQGGLVFLNVNDGSGKFQGLFKKEEIENSKFELFSQTVDVGDFIEITGTLFLTKRGEKTILAKDWRMLVKSLLPLPEKWHGLQDIEERFRKRYLDTLMSSDVKKRFIIRSQVISEIRKILDKDGYLEVETPALQAIAGGTEAAPFITHHRTLDIDLYLRIAPELYLKRLLVGGFSKVYELGRNFRNEGIDVTHNPEFTMLEFYESYSNASKQMAFVEKMFKALVKKVFDIETFIYNEVNIDVSGKFSKITYFDLLKRYALISNPENITIEEITLKATQFGVKVEPSDSIEKIMDGIYKKVCRPKLVQPTFITDYPVNMLPLAKKTEKNEKLVDAFQLVVGGMEIVKAFSELNDPLDQKERFMVQEERRKGGDIEAQKYDEEFLEALEYGMPPAGGVGIGIDRLVMLLTNVKNIKEVILFPTLRPRK